MTTSVRVDVVSVERLIFSGEARFVVAPAELGQVGILPGHAPFISRLRSGSVRLELVERDEEEVIYVSSGMLEVQPGRITILADLALPDGELLEERLEEETVRVEEAIKDRVTSVEFAKLEAELARAFRDLRGYVNLKHRQKGI